LNTKKPYTNFFNELKSTYKNDERGEMLEEVFRYYIEIEKDQYEYTKWFNNGISTNFGDKFVEPKLIDYFCLSRREDKSHDATIIVDGKTLKIEIKSTRCLEKQAKDETRTYFERAFLYKDMPDSKKLRFSIQQVKPACYDYVIGAIVCLDEIEIYLVPTSDFSFDDKKSKIKLSGQHLGNAGYEGQVSFNKLGKYCLGPLSELTPDDLNSRIIQDYRGKNKC
jgi:hypothetical protein